MRFGVLLLPGCSCIDTGKIDHDKPDIYEALGLSVSEKDEVARVVGEAVKMRKVSEMLEYIWSSKCGELSLEARIYATLRLGMDLYAMVLESVIAKREAETGGEASKTS